MTYRQARLEAASRLRDVGVENETAESGFLLEAACGVGMNRFLLCQMDEMTEEEENAYFALTAKRCERIPLQHLTGEQEFMGLRFKVNEHVLIPRQDTEVLVEEAIRILGQSAVAEMSMSVLDLCTGSGCIAVSIKSFCPNVNITASDVSKEALAVATENAKRNHTEVTFLESDLFSAITGPFDMIVSNPPYIPSSVIPTLMPEVRDHEPHLALDGTEDGLHFYKEITKSAASHLNPRGYLLFEIGYDQGEAVAELMRQHGFTEIEIIPDLTGLDRVVKGRRR